MPKRIQLSRAKGWRKPPGAIVVARPSRWGNPYVVGDNVEVSGVTYEGLTFSMGPVPLSPQLAVDLYRVTMEIRLEPWPPGAHPVDVAIVESWRSGLADLAGHDLACWCALDQPCHADVLLELAYPRRSTR